MALPAYRARTADARRIGIPHSFVQGDNGAFLELFKHYCKHEKHQSDSADFVIHGAQQPITTVANQVMARIEIAMRDSSVQATAATAASTAPARTTYAPAGAGRTTQPDKLRTNIRMGPH